MSLANQPIHPTPADLLKNHEGKQITLAHSAGMTLRQYYAGLAMQGLLANSKSSVSFWAQEDGEIARAALNHADALIAALES